MRTWVPGLGAVVALVVAAAVTSQAADMGMAAAAQLKGAVAEAKAAQAAGSLAEAREHLQGVVNCIEGPGGAMFKKMMGKMMSACEGKGNGLLPDAKASGSRWTAALPYIELANDNAATGIKASTLAKARAAGYAVQSLLERADKTMMMAK